MQHYVSLGEQGLNDRPWSSSFGEPSLVISADVLPWTQSIKTGAWGYLCPLLEDETTGDILEYCLAEWTHGKGFPAIAHYDVVAACASPGNPAHNLDQTITQFAEGMKFAENNGSEKTFNFESNSNWRDFSARITESDLRAAIRMDNEKFEGTGGNPNPGKGCGRGSSTEPKNWALIGIEHGIEGGGLSEMGESEANLQLWTEYTPKPPTAVTSSAVGVVETKATLAGSVNPNGSSTQYYFQYGRTTSYGQTTSTQNAGSGLGSIQAIPAQITGLIPGDTYHYRLVATNEGGTVYGPDVEFTTYGSLPGTLVGTLSAVEQTSGVIDVFERVSNGDLAHVWYVGGYWYGPQVFSATMESNPSAVEYGSGHLAVFWKGTNGDLWDIAYTGTWGSADNLGMGALGAGPHAVGQSDGTIDVFWRGGNNNLYHAWGSIANGFAGPQAMLSEDNLASEPSAVETGSTHLAVFWKGTNGDLWDIAYTGSWGSAQNRGMGTLNGGPRAAAQSNGFIDLFWKGGENGIYHAYGTIEGGFAGPEAFGGSLSSEPAPVELGSERLGVFWEGSESNLWDRMFIPGEGWQAAENRGYGPLGSGPVPVSALNDTVNVFWTGNEEGSIWSAWSNGSSWAGPESLNAPPPYPSVTTGPTADTQQTRATLGGTVNPNGYATTYYFEYGPTTSYGTKVPAGEASAGSGSGGVNVSYTISGLTPGKTYHYRLVAKNIRGTSYGGDAEVTTFSSLPASVVGTPSAVAQTDGTIDVFARLANGDLAHMWYVGGYWWGPQVFSATMESNPSAVEDGSGHLAVFWKGTNGDLWDILAYTGTWGSADNLGMGALGAGPHAVGQSNGTIDVFWRGGDNGLYHAWGSIANGFSGPTEMIANYNLESDPSPVETGSGSLAVFWKGSEGNLYDVSYTSSSGWSSEKSLGMGSLGGAPHAAGQSNGTIDIFWRGGDNGLYHAWGSVAGGFSGPQAFGGSLASESDPWPVDTGSGGVDVFWESSASALWDRTYTPSAGWSGAEERGDAPLGSEPIAVSPLNGSADVFWTGSEGTGVWTEYTGLYGWVGPEKLVQ